MKKTFKMQDLECANCAAKMEAATQKVDGVAAATAHADDLDGDAVIRDCCVNLHHIVVLLFIQEVES